MDIMPLMGSVAHAPSPLVLPTLCGQAQNDHVSCPGFVARPGVSPGDQRMYKLHLHTKHLNLRPQRTVLENSLVVQWLGL